MTIRAELADGRVLEFPDGTPQEVIQATVRRMVQQAAPPQVTPPTEPTFRQQLGGILQAAGAGAKVMFGVDPIPAIETAAVLGSGVVGEIAGGVAGIAALAGEKAGALEPGAGAAVTRGVQEALQIQPLTPAVRGALGGVGGVLAPAMEAFEKVGDVMGDIALDLTGSPAVAALFKTLPTAALEAVGGGVVFKQAVKTGARLTKAGKEALNVTEKQINRALVESAPDIDVIKDASRAIYKEIDNLGVTVQPKAYKGFLNNIIAKAKKERVNPRRTPEAAGALDEFVTELNTVTGKTVSDFDDLRKIAQDVANSRTPSDARIGAIMLDEIDSFLDNIGANAFKGPGAQKASGIGKQYRAARKLWGRARRAELIQEAMVKAERQASGFENGIRTQLRQIVNNPKRSRFFSKDEISAMDDVIKGSSEQNILKLVGRLGFSEGQATNILGGLGGTAVFGPVAPIVGQISRKLAQVSTKRAAALSDALVKAGPDGRAIAEAYLKLVPSKQRSASDLSALFVSQGVDVDDLLKSASRATREAAELAKGRLAFGIGAIAPQALVPEIELQQGQQ